VVRQHLLTRKHNEHLNMKLQYEHGRPSWHAEFKRERQGGRSYDTVVFSGRAPWMDYAAEAEALFRLPSILSQSSSVAAVVWEVEKASACRCFGTEAQVRESGHDELFITWSTEETPSVCLALRRLVEAQCAYRMLVLSPAPEQAPCQTNDCEFALTSYASARLRWYHPDLAMLVSPQPRDRVVAACIAAWRTVGYALPMEFLDD
jgi:hypothetical protein